MTEKFEILISYIKDLSVETPNAETLLFVKDNLKNYQLGIDINSKALKNKMIKIDINIKDKKILEKILLCDLQKVIYPKIEKIFLNLLSDSGFKGVRFEKKVDFDKLYIDRLN